MDLKSLSDEELQARLASLEGSGGSTPPPPQDNFKTMTDEQLAKRLGELQGNPGKEAVLQEMHPDFSVADRFVVKNFSNNNEAAVNYLQKRHPDLEIKVDDKSGQFLARKRDGSEPVYRTLDPDTGFFSGPKEMLRDLGDVAYDVASGIGTTAATTAGGLAGAAAGGVGAIPGAMAAGGASSAGLEGLKQSLGKVLGVGDFSGTDLALAGGAGAASPLLFGVGASNAQVAKKGLESLPKFVNEGALGYATSGLKKAGTKVAGFLSGAGAEPTETYIKNAPMIEAIKKDPEGRLKFIEDTGRSIDEAFQNKLSEKWNQVKDALGSGGNEPIISTDEIKRQFKQAIKTADKQAERGTAASRELADELRSAFDRHFMTTEKVASEVPVSKPTGLLDEFGQPIMTQGTETVENVTKKEIGNVTPDQALGLSRELSDMAGFRKLSPTAVAGDQFKNQSQAEKELMNLGAKLKRTLDNEVDSSLPVKAGPLKKEWGELRNLELTVNKITQNPQQAFSKLKNADINSNITMDTLNRVDRLAGTNLKERAKIATALEVFGGGRTSAFSPTSVGKRIPAAAIGASLGYFGGLQSGQPGMAPLGAAGGGLAGGMLGGPAALGMAIRSLLKTGKGLNALRPNAISPKNVMANTWLQMGEDRNGNN